MERKVALSHDGCNNVRGGYVLQHGNCNIVLQRFSGVSEADSGQSRPRCNSPRYWNVVASVISAGAGVAEVYYDPPQYSGS